MQFNIHKPGRLSITKCMVEKIISTFLLLSGAQCHHNFHSKWNSHPPEAATSNFNTYILVSRVNEDLPQHEHAFLFRLHLHEIRHATPNNIFIGFLPLTTQQAKNFAQNKNKIEKKIVSISLVISCPFGCMDKRKHTDLSGQKLGWYRSGGFCPPSGRWFDSIVGWKESQFSGVHAAHFFIRMVNDNIALCWAGVFSKIDGCPIKQPLVIRLAHGEILFHVKIL